ncbi:MAG: ABC transporter ATP-binding protein/permease [Lachnospiraceae bacterium]|nr:ABC transporter ATP-binding protein/permease [Lachnospiraceae bacterium]
MAGGIGGTKQFNVENAGRSESHKPKDIKGALFGLWGYLRQYRFFLMLALVLTISGNLLALVGPKLSGKAIDAIEPGKDAVDFDTVFYYAGLMVLFYIASSFFSYLLSVVMQTISRRMARQMRDDVFHKLLSLPVGYFDTHLSGDIISRVSYDIDVINTSLSTDLVQICASVITVAGSFAMMVTIEPKLVLVMVITIPMSVFYTKYMAKKTRPLFRTRSVKLGEMNGFVEEMVSGQKTIGAYAREEVVTGRFDAVNKEAVDAYYTADYYSCLVGPTVNFINNISLALVTVFGAVLYLLGSMSLGNISSFVLYSRKFSGPINEAANIISELQSALAAAERVFKLLSEEAEAEDLPGVVQLDDVRGNVVMKGVSFGYTRERTIIKNLYITADAGNMVAIVGPTGAGKTTIINLLMRFYDVDAGGIYVDGHETRELTRASLRRAFAMVLQDTWVFGGTIFENIAYGREDATMQEVVAAAKAAHIHSYIMRLPDGYRTVLSENGVNISKGQKQLLTIARAMLLDAKMLILDEATSNVDTRTEIRIQKAMRRLMAGKTCFVIAHRLSTIQNADQILVVDGGDVVEQGTHGELMEKRGFYYQLYASQFEA